MTYPDGYTDSEHRAALGRLLADIKAHGDKTTELCADTREKLDRLAGRLDKFRDQLDNLCDKCGEHMDYIAADLEGDPCVIGGLHDTPGGWYCENCDTFIRDEDDDHDE